jgi:hypothetical protein
MLLVSSVADLPGGDLRAWLDAGRGVACKPLALLITLTYIVIHGSYS